MLISQNKVRKEDSEWQKLENVQLSSITDKQYSIKSNENQSPIIDEYGKLFGNIFADYMTQLEIFSELQKSGTEVFINSFSTAYNFFSLSIDINTKFVIGLLKK